MALTGPQYEQFVQALVAAFDQYTLAQMLQFRRGKKLATITMGPTLTQLAFDLVGRAEAEGWTMDLLVDARQSNPGSAELLALAQQFGLSPGPSSRPELERIINEANSALDIVGWRTKLGELEGRVSRIEIPTSKGMSYGTGFLLGPDVLMTNYHVIEPLLDDRGPDIPAGTPADVIVRFDYKKLADGLTVHPGTEFALASTEWLLVKSPPSSADFIADPKPQVPRPDELDYALLRLATAAGNQPVGGTGEPMAQKRGWVEVPKTTPAVTAGSALFIVQHPKAEPLKLALDTDAVIGTNANGTRLSYRTNTEPGSSGSPCFNQDWQLVALHHLGDPDYTSGHKAAYNQGILMSAIHELLTQRKLVNLLGDPGV
jgi:hypothetical protein